MNSDCFSFIGQTNNAIMDNTITSLTKPYGKLTTATVKKFVLLFVLIFGMNTAFAQTTFSSNAATGNWNISGSWIQTGTVDADGIPDSNDLVIIRSGHTITVNVASAASSLTLETAGGNKALTLSANLAVGGNVLIDEPNNNGTIAQITVGANTLDIGGSLTINGGNNGANTRKGILSISTGTVNLTGLLTSAANTNAQLTFSGAGTFNIGGNWSFSASGSFTPSTSTVNFNGTTQSITVTDTFNNLTVKSTSTTTATGTPTVSGLFTIENSGKYIQTVGSAVPGVTRSLGASSTYEWQTGGGGSFPSAAGISFGNLIINTATGNNSAGGNLTTVQGNLIITNTTGGSYRLAANTSPTITIGGNIQVDGGLLNFSTGTGNPTLNVTGNVILNGGTLQPATSTGIPVFNVGGNWTNNGGSFTSTGIVNFNSTTANQTINGTAATQSFNAITVNKTGRVLTVGGSTALVNLAAASTVTAGSLTIPTGVTLAVTATLTNNVANGVTINGSFQINQGGFGATNDFVYGSSSNLIYNYTQTGTYGPVDAAHKYWPASNGPTNVILQMQNTNAVNAGTLQMGVARTITGALSTSNANNRTMTFDLQSFAFQSATISTSATSNLSLLGSAAITATGNVAISNASTFTLSTNTSSQLNIGGNLSVGNGTASGTFNSNGRGIFFTGAAGSTQVITKNNGGTAGTQTLDYLIISGTQNVQINNSPNGQTIALNANTGALQLNNSGGFDLNGQSVTQAGGSIALNGGAGGTAKTIISGSAATYTFQTANGSITSTNSGTVGFGSNITVVTSTGLDFGNISGAPVTTINGTLRINSGGIALNSSAPIYASGSTLNLNSGGSFGLYDNANTREAAGWFRNTASSGSAQHGVPWNFSVTGSGTNVFYNAVTDGFYRQINGSLTIGSGATFSLGGGSGMDFYLRGDFTRTGTFNNSSRVVALNGTSQSILGSATTFQDLILATSSSTKTFGVATTVSGNLNINTGVKADLGTFGSTSATLTTGGSVRGTGTSYGGTGSPAVNIDTTFFNNNTGYLNVGACGTYSLASTVNTSICFGNAATVSVTSSGANLPNGTYTVFYALGSPNAGSYNSTLTVSGGAGSGTFTTSSPLANPGATSIAIDYIVNGCVSRTISGNTATITVNPNNTVSAASSTPTLCINTALIPITHSTTVATGIGAATGLPTGVTAAWATNTITISGTPTVSGTFNYTIPLTGGCGSFNATGTIIVTPANTVGFASSTPTLCINTTLTSITHSTTGATGIGVATGLPLGVTAGWASNTITISGTPTSSGTFNYSVPLTGGCGSFAATGTIIVNGSSASVISGTSLLCLGSTTNLQVTITGGTSPYNVVYSAGSVGSYVSGSGIPVTPTSTTNYTLTSVTDANGCVGIGNSGSAVITIDATTSTNGGPWSNGSPIAGKSAIFDGTSVTLGADFTACSLTLKNSSAVTISSGANVILTGAVAVEAGSTFTFNNNANLFQTIPTGVTYTNTGNIIVKRNSSALKRFDYTLWSSPVAGQGVYSFSPFTFANRFYVYRSNTNVYNNADVGLNVTGLNPDGVNGIDSNNVQFAAAKGYLIRMPWDHPTSATVWNGTFTGVPNNGDIPFTMSNGGAGLRFNLVGNPYPSPISMTQFVADNSSNITGTLYFWRETNNNTSNNAYCSWAGGTFTSNGQAQVVNPNGIVRTGQGFIVEAINASTSLVFKNGQRSSDNLNQFFRNGNVNNDVSEANRFWLNLTNASGEFSQMAAGYMTGATNAVDLYDGKNINTGNVLLNSILDNADYTIQGKSLPFSASDVIPLSCKITIAGEYTIAIDHVDGLFTGGTQAIYLKDNLTSTEQNLQTGAYTFTSAAGSFTDRFEIRYESQLGVGNPGFTANNVIIYAHNNEFVINSGNTMMSSVKVFDIRGRLLQERKRINANQTTINGGMANEVLLVQITSEDGITVTRKVIR
jgi:hypothetical protein